ncbi:conserved hypothetical protein [Neospora caninum Liverpool]|nr:conserved hypothetical protein [Neospora caninum Liverpool]CBZ52941.1 conserved hypothetical protein [Neospora caninum Liverpool]|eukprot:XP_003882973.1 conserved hypothetical protein [Neospora caninum Liverpool]
MHPSSKDKKEEILSRLASALRDADATEAAQRTNRRSGGEARERRRKKRTRETEDCQEGGSEETPEPPGAGNLADDPGQREATQQETGRAAEDASEEGRGKPQGSGERSKAKRNGQGAEDAGDPGEDRLGTREGPGGREETSRAVTQESCRSPAGKAGDAKTEKISKGRQRETEEEKCEEETERQPARCGECGRRLNKRAKFCGGCGAPAGAAARETLRVFIENHFLPIREQEVGEHTRRVERGFWKSILEVLGDVAVSELSGVHWERYLKVLKKRNCSPRTQTLHQIAYQAALRYGVHTGRLPRSHDFRRIRGCTKRTLQSEPLRAREVPRLLDAAGSVMHRAMFAVGIGIGLRPSELLRLHWEDIDWRSNIASIRGSKTAASRAAVPLTDLARRELFKWWEKEGSPASGLCFYAEGARRPFQSGKRDEQHAAGSEEANGEAEEVGRKAKSPMRSFKKALQAAAKRASLETTPDGERRRIFPYLLRHSFATLAATSNPPVPLPVAQAVMRHTSSKMLLDTYAKAGTLVIKEGLKNFNV